MPERKLERVLGLPEVTFIAIGFTIGAGVFVFTGIVANIVGPALPLAYGLAVIPVFISMMPLAMLGSAIPTTGGNYRYPSRMVSPGLAFVGIWVYVLASFFGQIPLYAISCGNYIGTFLPDIPVVPFAIILLTIFYVINLLGIRLAAQVQGVMVVILIATLLFYSGRGFTFYNPEHFHNFFQKGTGNLALGVGLLTFTYLGSNSIIELGGEIRNPGKVIPRSLLIAFPVIMVVYLMVSTATIGALPWRELANEKEPLVAVGKVSLGNTGVIFFIVGGAILALTTTLNALFIVGTKSLLIIVDDGILPAFLGKLNRRFGTAHILLTLVWILSIIGVVSGFSLVTFASFASLGGMIIFFPVLISSLYLPRRFREKYEQSTFKLKGFWLWFCPVVGLLMIIFFSVIILIDLHSIYKILLFFMFILSGILIYMLRKQYLNTRGIDLNDIKKQTDWIENCG